MTALPPRPDLGPADIRDDPWDLTRQLAPLPKWGERRPGDHDWSGPGGTCKDCPAPSFLDTAGPCTWGTR